MASFAAGQSASAVRTRSTHSRVNLRRSMSALSPGNSRWVSQIVSAVQADAGSVWTYSPGLADFAVDAMRQRKIVGNGPDATLGNFETARINRMIEILGPVFASQNKPIKDGLTPEQLVTNEFVDPSVGLPVS